MRFFRHKIPAFARVPRGLAADMTGGRLSPFTFSSREGGGMQDFLAHNPVLQSVLDMTVIAVPLAVLFAFCGMNILCVTGEILSLRRRRAFYGKCALQLALLGQGLGWALLVGGRVWLHFMEKGLPEQNFLTSVHEACWMVLGLAVIFSCIYFLLWKTLAQQFPLVHIGLGMVSALQGVLSLLLVLAGMRLSAIINMPLDKETTIVPGDVLLPVWGTDYATTLCYAPLLLLGMPAAFACVWLLMRRKRDDYGRDHYNVVLPWCACWARNAWGLIWLLLLVFSGLEVYGRLQAGSLAAADGVTAGIRVLLWLIPPLLWLMATRSATPMRHKAGLVLALLISCAFMLPCFMGLTSWTPQP